MGADATESVSAVGPRNTTSLGHAWYGEGMDVPDVMIEFALTLLETPTL
jgi:hypothetical protein